MTSFKYYTVDNVWVGDRCKSNGQSPTGKFVPLSSYHDIYCCSLSGNNCNPENDCPNRIGTFAEAVMECKNRGLRLCTREELHKRACCGENCNSDGIKNQWTVF